MLSSSSKENVNLTFSSSSEIESFVRSRLGQPGTNTIKRKTYDGTFMDRSGKDIL